MTLDEARNSIGSPVIYRRKGQKPDEGVITRVMHGYVYVRYGPQVGSAITNPADIERVTS